MHEPRTAVMFVAEATWKESGGAVQKTPARVEDRSPGGACLRLKKPVTVGTRMVVKTRREHFSGAARYCRTDGGDYVVGIEQDKVMIPVVDERSVPQAKAEEVDAPPAPSVEILSLPLPPSNDEDKRTAVEHERQNGAEEASISRLDSSALLPKEPKTDYPPEKSANKVGEARKPMRKKLFELAHWRSNAEGAAGISNGNGNKEEAPHPFSPPSAQAPIVVATNFEGELLPVDDIYRTAGIMNVRHGIHRVIEMLRSEHLRGLAKDMKRAAVLMALDAAGIPIDQVLQDCKVRQTALDTYEASQKKQVEAEWARKAEENAQIQAELERVKAHYMARIARNLESIEREKATFSNWLTKKQQESQSIAEAADLFVQPPTPEPTSSVAMTKS
jgi:hypothetical protein